MIFDAKHSANYKQVIAVGSETEEGKGLYSIDTGNNGNLFATHYFSMNADHLEGRLQPMRRMGTKDFNEVKTKTLTLKPLGDWKKTPDL